jgi:hypothetical protein
MWTERAELAETARERLEQDRNHAGAHASKIGALACMLAGRIDGICDAARIAGCTDDLSDSETSPAKVQQFMIELAKQRDEAKDQALEAYRRRDKAQDDRDTLRRDLDHLRKVAGLFATAVNDGSSSEIQTGALMLGAALRRLEE